MPAISIVTINLNNVAGLKRTIDSVLAQTYQPIEFIIIDGNSTDGSLAEIKNVAQHLSYWVSEPDAGLYNAMNKGLKAATGDYVLFLNSGDYLVDKFVIEKLILDSASEEVIYGNLCVSNNGKARELKSASKIYYSERYQHNLPPHPVILFKRGLIDGVGFDEKYKIIADVVLIARLFSNHRLSYKFVDIPVTVFDTNGVSSVTENNDKIYRERENFIRSEFPTYLKDFEKVYKRPTFLQLIAHKFKNLSKL